jgi:F1F0 ATPase subunit 2
LALDAARVSVAFRHPPPEWAVLPILAVCLALGIVVGALYFRTLWWTTRRFGANGRMTAAVALMAGRFVLLGGALFLASLAGAAPLLTMALGILVARYAVVRRVRAPAR